VGGSNAWARVYDIGKTLDPPQNPNSGSSSSNTVVLLAAAAAWQQQQLLLPLLFTDAMISGNLPPGENNNSCSAPAHSQQPQQQHEQRIGPPTNAEARYSRVYGLADEPVVRLCAEALLGYIGIEHDINIWAPTAPKPQAPSPTSL
jgi:hypothetical protein